MKKADFRKALTHPWIAGTGGLLIIALCWNTPLLQPLKWLVVLFHELSHAAVGVLTGGRVVSLNVTHREGGICLIAGGNRTLILLAGYPGSLCAGLLALHVAGIRRWRAPALLFLGVLLVLTGLFYVRPWIGFGLPFTILTGVLLGAAGWTAAPRVQQALLWTIGVTSCLYAVLDAVALSRGGGAPISDATLLADHTGIPAWIWAQLWMVLTAGILFLAFRRSLRIPGRNRQ